jgi:ornithine carbamoyltransferase
MAGLHVRVAAPADFAPADGIVQSAKDIAGTTGGSVTVTTDVLAAADGADVLYTDVWASMGQEAEATSRAKAFVGYQISDEVLAAAAKNAIVLHCLPAHRGEEIAASVMDGPHSVVFDQAENRLHAQKALLAFLVRASSA